MSELSGIMACWNRLLHWSDTVLRKVIKLVCKCQRKAQDLLLPNWVNSGSHRSLFLGKWYCPTGESQILQPSLKICWYFLGEKVKKGFFPQKLKCIPQGQNNKIFLNFKTSYEYSKITSLKYCKRRIYALSEEKLKNGAALPSKLVISIRWSTGGRLTVAHAPSSYL